MSNDGSFQPNFVCFTNDEVVRQEPIGGRFKGNQSNEFKFVQFANGSGGLEKRMVDWVGNKTGRTYRAEILAAQEFLASRVGEVMNAPVRDCRFMGGDAKSIVMPYIEGSSGAEINLDIPDNPQGTALVLFDYLVANADRRPKNIIFTPDNRIVGIDHALCNFRPRVPSPALVLRLLRGGVDIAFLEALRPKFEALEPMFSSVGMADKHANLMDNHDNLVKVLKTVSALATIEKESRLHFSKGEALTPPQGVQDAAERALGWLKEGLAGDGFTPVGRKRASDLAHGHAVSLETIKRMKAYFDRHQVDKKAEGFQHGEDGYPSPGRVAWDAWGGDAGYSWAESIVEREILKGDTVGHEFHGNQWTGGGNQLPLEDTWFNGTPLLEGWHRVVNTANPNFYKITLVSDKGNKAIFANQAMPALPKEQISPANEKWDCWRPDMEIPQAALKALDKYATGKTLNFTLNSMREKTEKGTFGYVSRGDPDTIHFGKYSTWIKRSLGNATDDATLSPPYEASSGSNWSVSSMFSNIQTSVEGTIAHELGHSDFFGGGHKISEIFDALTQTAKDVGYEGRTINWEKATQQADMRYAKYFARGYDVVRFEGNEYTTTEYGHYINNRGTGSNKLTDAQSATLVAMGATTYGSGKLQELVGETHAMWKMPQFTETPLMTNIAKALNWGERPVTKSVASRVVH